MTDARGLLDPRSLPQYSAGLGHTYAFGRFAVNEALTHRPEDVQLVVVHGHLPAEHLAALSVAAERAGVTVVRQDAAVERLRKNAKVNCLAVVSKRVEELGPEASHVVLIDPSHPGNVGTAIRSMVAFGFTDLALVANRQGPGLDPWGAYVVRASVGLRFAVRCRQFESARAYVAAHGSRRLYTFSATGTVELDDVTFEAPFSLVFGPEWQGPEADAGLALPAATVVKIPQSDRVESLNLAISVSIAAYRARHLRPPTTAPLTGRGSAR